MSEAKEAAPPEQLIADDVERKPDLLNVRLQSIIWWIFTGVAVLGGLIALLVLWIVSDLPVAGLALFSMAWLAMAVVLSILSLRWPALEYRCTSYRVNRERIEIRTGVYWRHVLSVPRSRVQHTDVSQGPIERQLGLATLILHTAGTEHATVHLPGLAHATASSIRDHLVAGGLDDAV